MKKEHRKPYKIIKNGEKSPFFMLSVLTKYKFLFIGQSPVASRNSQSDSEKYTVFYVIFILSTLSASTFTVADQFVLYITNPGFALGGFFTVLT